MRILWITIFVSISLGIVVRKFGFGNITGSFGLLRNFGLVFTLSGLFIRWIAILQLKSMSTVDVSIQKNHTIVKTGIYKHIRHPAYIGSLVSFLGLGFALLNWLSIIIIFFPILFTFSHRIKIEEKGLISEFGDEYLNYLKNTNRLIPYKRGDQSMML